MNTFLEDILAQPAALHLTLASMLGKNRAALEGAASSVLGPARRRARDHP